MSRNICRDIYLRKRAASIVRPDDGRWARGFVECERLVWPDPCGADDELARRTLIAFDCFVRTDERLGERTQQAGNVPGKRCDSDNVGGPNQTALELPARVATPARCLAWCTLVDNSRTFATN